MKTQTKVTHTPGPWKQFENNWVGTDEQPQVARVFERVPSMGFYSPLRPEMEANAALIASAPCLLEALEDVIADFNDKGLGKVTQASINKAQAAISRAGGVSHD